MASRKRIVYLISGPAHLPYLVVSLCTLRQHWDGEVEVYAWPESFPYVRTICCDSRLQVDKYGQREPAIRGGRNAPIGQNSQFLDKIKLVESLKGEADVVLYLDADTTVHGDLSELFVGARDYGFCASQWNDWLTTSKMVGGRIRRLRNVPEVEQSLVDQLLAERWPSVNGGVWATRPESPVLPLWYSWTLAAGPIFIADETVLHTMMVKFSPKRFAVACRWGKYNSSPKHRSGHLPADEVAVYHYHGDSNVRPDKSKAGFDRWWPLYQECLEQNVGGIRDWRGEIYNKHMDKLERA